MRRLFRTLSLALLACVLAACSTYRPADPDMPSVAKLDLPRFMGDWYVYAALPTPADDNAFNGVQRYSLNPNGTIGMEYNFRAGKVDGRQRTLKAVGYVQDALTSAKWHMEVFWPVASDVSVLYVSDDYSLAVVGTANMKYAYLMSRQPQVDDTTYSDMIQVLQKVGYDVSRIRKVPQQW